MPERAADAERGWPMPERAANAEPGWPMPERAADAERLLADAEPEAERGG